MWTQKNTPEDLSHTGQNALGPMLETTTGTWGHKNPGKGQKSSTGERTSQRSLSSVVCCIIYKAWDSPAAPYLPLKEYNVVMSSCPQLKRYPLLKTCYYYVRNFLPYHQQILHQ